MCEPDLDITGEVDVAVMVGTAAEESIETVVREVERRLADVAIVQESDALSCDWLVVR